MRNVLIAFLLILVLVAGGFFGYRAYFASGEDYVQVEEDHVQTEENLVQAYIPPETFDYDLSEHGEPSFIVEDGWQAREIEVYGLSSESRIAELDSLEYLSEGYDANGNRLGTLRVRIANIKSGNPDFRFDYDGIDVVLHAEIASYTARTIWGKMVNEESFSVMDEGRDFASAYDAYLSEEKMYIEAVARWDGEGPILMPLMPFGGKGVIYNIVFNPELDPAIFVP